MARDGSCNEVNNDDDDDDDTGAGAGAGADGEDGEDGDGADADANGELGWPWLAGPGLRFRGGDDRYTVSDRGGDDRRCAGSGRAKLTWVVGAVATSTSSLSTGSRRVSSTGVVAT